MDLLRIADQCQARVPTNDQSRHLRDLADQEKLLFKMVFTMAWQIQI